MTAYGATPAHLNEVTCIEAARWYLEHSLYPIPWEVRDGRKAVTLRGFSYDEYLSAPREKIEEVLSLWQDSWQVGLALAEPGGIFAVDIDNWEELHSYEKDHGELPRESDTWWQATGRDDGGAHVFFQRGHLLSEWPGHGPFSRVLGKLELKSKGFVAVPPSTHPSGRQYQWIGNSSGITGVPHLLAAYLNERQSRRAYAMVDAATGTGYTATGIASSELISGGIPTGVPQDNALRDLVWDLVQQGMPDAFIQSTWQVVVDKSALINPHQPWTQTDFERHLRGAREKLGGGLSAAELSWVRRTGVNPHVEADGEETPKPPGAGVGAPTAPATGPEKTGQNGQNGQTPLLEGVPAGPGDLNEHLNGSSPGFPGPVALDPGPNVPRPPRPPEGADVTGRTDAEHRVWLSGQLLREKADGSLDLIATFSHLPYSDLACAQLLVRLYPGLFHFSTQERRWRIWDGVIHRPAEDGDIANLIVRFAEAYRAALNRIKAAMMAEGAAAGDDDATVLERYATRWKQHRTYRDRLWDQPRQALLSRQMEMSVCAISESKFDRDPDMAACDNGVLTLGPAGVRLEEHSCERLITKRTGDGIAWEPEAKCPVFTQFLESSVQAEDQRLWLQTVLGLTLFGRPIKGFVNLIGKTDSGKTTLSRIMHLVFGTYAAYIGIDAFLEGSHGNNEFRIHELKGVRLALAAEPGPGRKIDSEAIKSLTGQDLMRTRVPYGTYIEWRPQALIMISSNQPMRLDTADVAMMKRLRPVQFTQAQEVDPTLERRISHGELPGVLRWLCEGAERGFAGGETAIDATSSMVALRESMAEAVDDVLQFLNDGFDQGWLRRDFGLTNRREFASVSDMYNRYVMWCGAEGIRLPVARRTFSNRIGRLYEVINSGGKKFHGLAIK
jgi:P4 family phage/plasmid primase-like protien